MKDEDRERLTEFLGDKWWPKVKRLNMRSQFVECDDNRTFTTEADMMALYKRLHEMETWVQFLHWLFRKAPNYDAWLFCLSGEGYEERCQMVADFIGEGKIKVRPKIVCLCGSTRFKDAFDEANYRETMAGKIVLSVGFFMHASGNKHGGEIGATPAQKVALDELHKRKIDLADEVLILDVGGYVGESTRSELEYARSHGKIIRYLEAADESRTS